MVKTAFVYRAVVFLILGVAMTISLWLVMADFSGGRRYLASFIGWAVASTVGAVSAAKESKE